MLSLQPITDCNQCTLGRAYLPDECAFGCDHYAQGVQITQQGAELDRIFFVKRGMVLRSESDTSGHERACSVRSVGAILGWESMIDEASCALIIALSPVELCSIDVAELKKWTASNSLATRVLLGLAIQEVQRTANEKWMLTGSALARLSRFLFERCRAGLATHPLEIKHQLLARILAVRPETLSRAEANLRKRGIVSKDRGLFVQDIGALACAAEGSLD